MRRLLPLLALALLAAAMAAPLAPAQAPPPPGEHRKAVEVSPEVARGWVVNEPDPKRASGGFAVLEGETTTVWLAVLALQEGGLRDAVNLTAEGATLNRSRAAVDLDRGDVARIPVRVTPEPGAASVVLHATLERARTPEGAPVRFSASGDVIPPVTVELVSPKGLSGVAHAGWEEGVEFRARVTNVGAAASAPFNLTLHPDGRGPAESRRVEALAPGASAEVSLGTHGAEASSEPTMDRGVHHGDTEHVQFTVGLQTVAGDGVAARSFRVDDGVLRDVEVARAFVQYHRGLTAFLEDANLTLGGASWVTVVVANYGDREEGRVEVQVRVRPSPAAYYGPDTSVRETHALRLAPGELERVNVTFTPKVAGSHEVMIETLFSDYRYGTGSTIRLPTPLTATAEGSAVLRVSVGESGRSTLRLESSEGLAGAELGVAVASAEYYGMGRDGVSFARFTTVDDLMEVRLSTDGGDLAPGSPVWANLTVTAKAAGRYHVIPYARVDGLIYPADRVSVNLAEEDVDEDGLPLRDFDDHRLGNHLSVLASADDTPLGRLWLPLGLVLAGFGGHRAYRRTRVR